MDDLLRTAAEFVGREREVAVLAHHAATARGGTVRGVLVHGLRGTGKSTLLRWAAMRQADLGSRVLFATGRGDRTPLSALRELLEPVDPPVPEVVDVSPQAVYPLFRSLLRRVTELAAEAPLCLVVDDLDACDTVTARWLDFLIRRAAELPLLVLTGQGSRSDDQMDGIIADLGTRSCCEALNLGPFSPQQVAELVSTVLGGTPEPDFIDACHRLSGGNPRHLTALLTELKAGDTLPDEHGVLRVDGIGRSTVSTVVARRLHDQPDRVRVIAAAVAVLGPEDREFVRPLAGFAARVFDSDIVRLGRRHLTGDGLPPHLREWFRLAVLEVLPPEEVDALRARAAMLLDDGGRPVEDIARQLVLVDHPSEAWMSQVLLAAAATMSARGAPDTAAGYLTKVVDTEPDNVSARVELAAQLAGRDPMAALDHLSTAFERTSDKALRGRLAVMFAHIANGAGEAREMLLAAARELDAAPELAGTGDLRTFLDVALLEVDLADRSAAKGAVDRARDVEPPRGRTVAERCLLGVLSEAGMWSGGSMSVALAQARRALTDQSTLDVRSMLSAATVLRCSGESGESIAVLDRGADGFARRGDELARSRVLAHRAMTLLSVGDLIRAEQDAHEAFDIVERHSWHAHELRPRIVLATVAVSLGQTEWAERLLDGVPQTEIVRRTGEYHEFLHARAWTRFGHDDLDGALDDLYRCGRAMTELDMQSPLLTPWWADAAVMAAVLGRRADVVAVVLDGAELLSRWSTPESVGFSLMARGLVSGRRAVALVGQAVEKFATLPPGIQHARAQLLLGWACLTAGDERTARSHLRTAVLLALRCEHRPLADRARQLLLDAGGRMRMSEDVEQGGLTVSEHRVARMAAAGETNREIADALFVTLRTVELHLTRVYRKLGLSGRSQLCSTLGARNDPPALAPATG